MGSFFGDLYKASFVPPDNILARFMAAVTVLDPSQKTMPALGVALLLGILNQFFGIGLKMYGAVRAGDVKSAICDGLFWIIPLTGFVLVIAANFVPVMPPVLGTVGLVVLGGLNPAAALEEAGVRSENRSLAGLLDYQKFPEYRHLNMCVRRGE